MASISARLRVSPHLATLAKGRWRRHPGVCSTGVACVRLNQEDGFWAPGDSVATGLTMHDILLITCIFAAALLYSSVGQAGASGYLAAMAIFGVAPGYMRPAALVLNILVAAIATVRFHRAGCFSWSIFWPFAAASVPFAFIGGALTLPGTIYRQVVGLVLLFAAYQVFRGCVADAMRRIPAPLGLFCGAGIGLLSGLTGTGGGIFLTPLLLFMGWAETKESAGVSAAFILVNSIAGMVGLFARPVVLPNMLAFWAVAAVAGGLLGSGVGSKRLGNPALRRLLAVVLVIAGGKLMLT